jgi:L-fuconolactonase
MIIDSHCHAWARWPYDDSVPDISTRASVEQLLYEMDRHGVERAAVICARIDGSEHRGEDNNYYVARAAARHPDRLFVFVDVDCMWTSEYHTPGAARRLRQAEERYGPVGFAHYVPPDNDGWLVSDDGMEFFGTAADLGLIASLAIWPSWHADLREVAGAYPNLRILVHHLGLVRPASPTIRQDLDEVTESARKTNIYLKASGFHYLTERAWGFPFLEAKDIFRVLCDAYGTDRLCWGSDFPSCQRYITYTQSLEAFRIYADFLDSTDVQRILGDNLQEILPISR